MRSVSCLVPFSGLSFLGLSTEFVGRSCERLLPHGFLLDHGVIILSSLRVAQAAVRRPHALPRAQQYSLLDPAETKVKLPSDRRLIYSRLSTKAAQIQSFLRGPGAKPK